MIFTPVVDIRRNSSRLIIIGIFVYYLHIIFISIHRITIVFCYGYILKGMPTPLRRVLWKYSDLGLIKEQVLRAHMVESCNYKNHQNKK